MNTVDYLLSLEKIGIKLGLQNISCLLQGLGNPERKFPSIHITGTNGKGSTLAFLASVLQKAGYTVGCFTSPHLHHLSERIRVNGQPLDEPSMEEAVKLLLPLAESMASHPTFFEMVTAMGFYYFAQQRIDIALVEVGMGGRFDATNVLEPLVAIVTNVALEHTQYLGLTLADIAREKAGIIKRGARVVVGLMPEEAMAVIDARAREQEAVLYKLGEDFTFTIEPDLFPRQRLTYRGLDGISQCLTIALGGSFQGENASVALTALELLQRKGFTLPQRAIEEGMAEAHWPGRMELMKTEPLILLDGAHNPHAARRLAQEVKSLFPHREVTLLVGILKDKDAASILEALAPLSKRLIVSQPQTERAMEPERLALLAEPWYPRVMVKQDIEEALHYALSELKAQDLLLITGSLYTIAEARELLHKIASHPL